MSAVGSSKKSERKRKEIGVEEDKINELQMDEDDQGNLDDNFTNNASEMKLDDVQTEDMNLGDDMELDNLENDVDSDDSGEIGDDGDVKEDDDTKNDDDEGK